MIEYDNLWKSSGRLFVINSLMVLNLFISMTIERSVIEYSQIKMIVAIIFRRRGGV
jgi:hypothetical protein